FFAFFNSDAEVDIPAPLPGEMLVYERKKTEFEKRAAELRAELDAYKRTEFPNNRKKWEAELNLPELRKLPSNIVSILLLEPAKRTSPQEKELAAFYDKSDKKLTELTQAVTNHAKTAPSLTQAPTLTLGSPRKTHILVRGDFLRPGVEVTPGVPAILMLPTARNATTRLDLARWIVDPANPLTARVITNWMWQQHFGRAIVATPEDFGTQGEKACHPELLDYLATEFIRQNWSMKAMHRLIVTSSTYRQSSKVRPELANRDPPNVLLARQNRPRLDAEIVRDAALSVS